MILNRKSRVNPVSHTLTTFVVEINVGQFHLIRVKGSHIDAETVVL
jgi:hypothetical protein